MNKLKQLTELSSVKNLLNTVRTRYSSVNPVNNQVEAIFDNDSNSLLESKINKAAAYFKEKHSVESRIEHFKALKANLEGNREALASLFVEEMGKPIVQARGEIDKTIGHIDYYSDNILNHLKEDEINNKTHLNRSVRRAAGTVFVVSPFNFPLWVPFKAIIPILMSGNSVLHKPAPSLPRSSIKIAEIMAESGFADSYSVTFASNDQTEGIIGNSKVRGVNFTGSSAAGRTIASLSGRHLKKCVMELGGSDPFIVLGDADVDLAVKHAIEGRLRNNGQACICAKRLILDKRIEDEFTEKLIKGLKEIKIGDPKNDSIAIGPLARIDLLFNLARQSFEAQNSGATVVYGEEPLNNFSLDQGNYFSPLVLKNLDRSAPTYREEFFGPVFNLFTASSEEEMVDIANDTEYGLGASIFTTDEEHGMRLAEHVESGSIFINSATVSSSDSPSGGVKNSGFGRTCGPQGALEFTDQRIIGVFKQ